MTEEQVQDWRESPVTEALKKAMRKQVELRKNALQRAYMRGEPRPEAERIGLLMLEAWTEDFFTSSAEDIRQFIEDDNGEQERHQAG